MSESKKEGGIALKVHDLDNVATVFAERVSAGTVLTVRTPRGEELRLKVREDIPYGHKVAVVPIAKGSKIIKYGEEIGAATRRIAKGSHVHVHNLESLRGRGDLERQGVTASPAAGEE